MPVTESAREIALAFGVPPMLLAIAGDNTYANYQEANRAFWRQSVLPLAARIACAPPAAVSTISYARFSERYEHERQGLRRRRRTEGAPVARGPFAVLPRPET